ncbi:MAG: hypothetical protein ACFCBW_16150 [Candidatus Competibacterales bacterium]
MKKNTVLVVLLLINFFVFVHAQPPERNAVTRIIAGISLSCRASGNDSVSVVACLDAGKAAMIDGINPPGAFLEACKATRTALEENRCYKELAKNASPGPIKEFLQAKTLECADYGTLSSESFCWRRVLMDARNNWKPLR